MQVLRARPMTHPTNSHIQPRRAGRERSKNGCSTCKTRKVKCDETRPYCQRCTKSGRKCEGPVVRQFQFIHHQPISRSATPTPQLEISLFAPQHGEDERRAFHYFTKYAAPIFVGAVDAMFWKDLIPRLALSYNFVWDVVVCVSSLLEHVPYTSSFEHVPYTLPTTITDSTDITKVISREHRQALRFYQRAIVSVRQLADSNQIDDSVVVLSYILFASVEFQQQNVKTGNNFVKRCCRLLTENLTLPYTRQNSTTSQAIFQVVTPFVLRRAIVVATLGNALPPQWVANNEVKNTLKAVPSGLPTLEKFRDQFHSLVCQCYEVIRLADFIPNMRDDDPNKVLFLSERQSLSNKLMQWKASVTAISSQTPNAKTDWIRSYLLMYWAVCYTFLATCISLRETSFDDYMDYFAEIVEHATVYLKYSVQSTNGQLLSSSDPGVIPPLYFCATKCRDPILRRKALQLMRQAPRQENLWAFVASDRVVAKVILAEEGENQLSFSKDSPESRYASLPPEERRFAYVNVVGRQALGGKQRQALELSRFEYAADGSRRLLNDYTWLDDAEEFWPDAQRESLGTVTQNVETYLGVPPNMIDVAQINFGELEIC